MGAFGPINRFKQTDNVDSERFNSLCSDAILSGFIGLECAFPPSVHTKSNLKLETVHKKPIVILMRSF